MARPFFNLRINELEREFDRRRGDIDFLRMLIDELSHRSVDRAVQLKDRAVQALGVAPKAHPPETPMTLAPQSLQEAPAPAPDLAPAVASRVAEPMPPINDDPVAVVTAWTALEVLSPPSFNRPEDLARGDRPKLRVAPLNGQRLPWEGTGEKARPATRLYYQVVLGSVELAAAVSRLMTVFSDARPERPATRGEAVLAIVIVDRAGLPIEESATAVSSFGWGLPKALRGDLEALGNWPTAERELVKDLDGIVRRSDLHGKLRPLDATTIMEAFEWLLSRLDIPREPREAAILRNQIL